MHPLLSKSGTFHFAESGTFHIALTEVGFR
jgi:hypothetical protein